MDKELLERIEALERRVMSLEAKGAEWTSAEVEENRFDLIGLGKMAMRYEKTK